jgi:hypothetical protein
MATAAGRRSAVVGWWATWPAEAIDGVVVSDRALASIDNRVAPAPFLERYLAIEAAARASPGRFGGNEATRIQDQVMTATAQELCGEGFDLVLVYLRSIDIACHFDWKYLEPETFGNLDPAEVAAGRERIADAYEAADQAVGALREAIGPDATVLVLSDHGFHAMEREEVLVLLDLDAVFAELGLLERAGGGSTWRGRCLLPSPNAEPPDGQKVRFCLAGREPGGTVDRRRSPPCGGLEAALVESPGPADRPPSGFATPPARSAAVAAPTCGRVLEEAPQRCWPTAARSPLRPQISVLSGTTAERPQACCSRRPVIEPAAAAPGITVLDVAPTVLYAMGLPTAESFDGQARLELFRAGFRRHHPLHTILTWGEPRDGEGTASVVDQAIIEQLAALGFIQ